MLDLEQLNRLVLVCEGILISIISRIFYRQVLPDIIKSLKTPLNTIVMPAVFNPQTISAVGSPFTYNLEILQNEWSPEYIINLKSNAFVIDDTTYTLFYEQDAIDNRISPDTALFNVRGSYTGTYMNNFTGEEEVTLQTAAYEPEIIAEGDKNPLIIWLHGQGEGGMNPDICILGNEVSALAKDEIQSYFTTDHQTGAYVLVVQCETYWMDEGDGKNGYGSGVSRYTEILMDTIKDYIASNPDADENRIYLGGCSNGGYMTMNMIINYPDYFAASYPICEAYAYHEFLKNEDGTYKHVKSEETCEFAN